MKDIFQKISNEFRKGIRDESQIVYILSRMIIVLEKEGQKENYPYLLFYRNWTLHDKLSYPHTVKILLDIFKDDLDPRKDGHQNAKNLIKTNSRFFTFDVLKNELVAFFETHNLSLDLLNENWISFTQLLLEVIKECPIEFSSEILEKMELIKDESGCYCYKFSIVDKRDKPMVKLKLK